MTLNEAETLTNSLLQKHAPEQWKKGWRFGTFLPPGSTLGRANHKTKRIDLGRNYVLRGDRDDVLDTILHEIAHALAGYQAAHGRVWRAYALMVGARPRACKSIHLDLGTRYVGTCPFGCIFNYQRRPAARTMAHGKCRSHNHAIHWKDTHTGMPLSV